MDPQADASENIIQPSRAFWVGRSRSGKTTHMVDFICNKGFHKQVDRIIIVCPTFLIQATYSLMRMDYRIAAKIHPDDIHTSAGEGLFTKIANNIFKEYNESIAVGGEGKRILVIVDDLAGNSAIHNNGKGSFANFAVACTHWNTSLFVISQSPTAVDPQFRKNCESLIIFQSEGIDNIEWLKRSYQSLAMTEMDMKGIILLAWRGGLKDNSEWGKHFLFIFAEPRNHTRFFIDFKKEINIL